MSTPGIQSLYQSPAQLIGAPLETVCSDIAFTKSGLLSLNIDRALEIMCFRLSLHDTFHINKLNFFRGLINVFDERRTFDHFHFYFIQHTNTKCDNGCELIQ